MHIVFFYTSSLFLVRSTKVFIQNTEDIGWSNIEFGYAEEVGWGLQGTVDCNSVQALTESCALRPPSVSLILSQRACDSQSAPNRITD